MSFGGILRQSTAVDVLIGPFVDSVDGDSEETGLTIAQADVRLSKNGQTAGQKSDNTTAAHDADGFYNCELDATDTNTVGQLTLYVHVAGALAVRHDYQVIEEAVYDALFEAAAPGYVANAPVNVAQFGGVNLTASGGRPEVNTTLIEGTDATNQIRDSVVDDATRIDASALNTLSSHDPGETIMGATDLGTGAGLTSLATAAAVAAVQADTDDLQSKVGTPANLGSGATVAGNLADIESQTDDIGAAGAGLTALASAANLATVAGYLDTEIADIKAKTDNLPTDPADASDIASAFATVNGKLDTIDTVADAIKVTTDKLDDTLEDDGGTFRFTENALEEAPSGGGSAPTAAEIADAVWEEPLADHENSAGSTAEALAQAGGSGASAAQIADAVWNEPTVGHEIAGTFGEQAKTDIDAILLDTEQIGASGLGLFARRSIRGNRVVVPRGEAAVIPFDLEQGSPAPTYLFTLACERNMVEKVFSVEPEPGSPTSSVTIPAETTDREPGTYYWDLWNMDTVTLIAIGTLEISAVVRLPA